MYTFAVGLLKFVKTCVKNCVKLSINETIDLFHKNNIIYGVCVWQDLINEKFI